MIAVFSALWLFASAHSSRAATIEPPKSSPRAPEATPGLSDRARDDLASLADREIESQSLIALSIAIARRGHIIHTQHWGFADREQRIPASDETMYRWASISKPVTAVAAMQLVESGRLDLEKNVRDYVNEWPEKPHPITTRQLLTHQGGIVHYLNGKVISSPKREDVEHPYADVVDALATFNLSPLVCEPGTKHSYSTHGYILASAVIQRAGGETFWHQVRDRISKPAGMTTFRPDYQWENISHRAVGYRRNPRKADQASGVEPMIRSTNTDVSWKLGGGGFISTVGDLSRFSIALLGDRLVTRTSRDMMWSPQETRDGKKTTYGLGFHIRTRRGALEVSHSGAQEKTSTMLLIVPDDQLSIAIMTNTEGARLFDFACDIADAVRGVPPTGKQED